MTTRDPVAVIADALRDLADAAGRGEYPGEDGAARYIVDRLRAAYGTRDFLTYAQGEPMNVRDATVIPVPADAR